MFEGGCACGAIRYACDVAALAMLNCHWPDFTAIRAGSLDDPKIFVPGADVWVASTRSRNALDPALPKFERNRGR